MPGGAWHGLEWARQGKDFETSQGLALLGDAGRGEVLQGMDFLHWRQQWI